MQFNLKGILGGVLAAFIFSSPALAESPLSKLEVINSELTALSSDELGASAEARSGYADSVRAKLDEILGQSDYASIDMLSKTEQSRFNYLVNLVSRRIAVLGSDEPTRPAA